MQLLALALLALIPAALAVDIPVSVGAANSFAFSPTSITAEVGDTVTFTFISRNRETHVAALLQHSANCTLQCRLCDNNVLRYTMPSP